MLPPSPAPHQARGRLEAGELDLVVCDVEMPGGSGFDRIRSVRERGGDLAVATC